MAGFFLCGVVLVNPLPLKSTLLKRLKNKARVEGLNRVDLSIEFWTEKRMGCFIITVIYRMVTDTFFYGSPK